MFPPFLRASGAGCHRIWIIDELFLQLQLLLLATRTATVGREIISFPTFEISVHNQVQGLAFLSVAAFTSKVLVSLWLVATWQVDGV